MSGADMGYIVPPECAGQMVEIAYSRGCDDAGRVWRRITDRSDSSDSSVSYHWADVEDFADWDPGNTEPDDDDLWTAEDAQS